MVAGDIPTEHEEPLSKFMIHLHPSWKIDRIESELREYLEDPERLQQMALDGFIYARRYLTSTYVQTAPMRLAYRLLTRVIGGRLIMSCLWLGLIDQE